MNHSAPDLTLQIPRDAYYQIVHSLRGALPPPVTDDPADLVRRDNAMIGRVAAMLPGNPDEAAVAAQCVAADVQALDCLRLARGCGADVERALKCSAQAACMMRQARSARTLLLRLQATRQKREAEATSLGHATMVEYCALGLMAEALGRAPLPPIEQPPPAPEPDPPIEPNATTLTEAERYATIYPRRTALIRSLGGLPAQCNFAPPLPELVRAIIAEDSLILRALDPQVVAVA